MFSFFHRRSVINVDCFTSNNDAYKFTPVVTAIESRPEWFDSIVKPQQTNTKFQQYILNNRGMIDYNTSFDTRTLRTCHGFTELYRKGFIIENWCDLAINVDSRGISYHYSNGLEPILHKEIQTAPGFTNHHICKLKSPWVIQTKEDVQFLELGTEWSFDNYIFQILPGVLNFHYQTSSNIFLVVRKDIPQQFQIPMGHPLAHFVPLTDKKIKIHNHIVTEQEFYTKIYNVTGTANGWRRTVGLIRRNDKRKQCPFDFGD